MISTSPLDQTRVTYSSSSGTTGCITNGAKQKRSPGYSWTGRTKAGGMTMPRKLYTAHEVACILAEAFGDDCACNLNGNDEWLPEKCEVIDSCPEPVGVACWEQYLKWRGYR